MDPKDQSENTEPAERIDLSQYRIAKQCLTKSEAIGAQPSAEELEQDEFLQLFDHSPLVEKDFVASLMPYEYTYCVDQNSKLISMQISFTDPNDPEFKPIILPLAGPKEPEKKEEEKLDEQQEGNEDEENG